MQERIVVCYFGNYDSNYSRNRVLISGLRQNGAEVIECNDRSKFLLKYLRLFLKHHKIKNKYNVMVVGFPGQSVMLLAKLICRKKIIFDAFLSLYDSMVFDRKVCLPNSLKAKYYWFLDWFSCGLADKILLDTRAHIDYFVKTFKIRPEKFTRIFVGTDKTFTPQVAPKVTEKFLVHFHGSYIPLQGIQYIIDAAEILKNEDIIFQMVGRGQEFGKIMEKVNKFNLQNNFNFINSVPLTELPAYIAKADLCLGVFGDSAKTDRVIPNKVYEYLAMEKPIITAETSAAKELFEDNREVAFCQPASGQSLAKKIIELKNDPAARDRLAANGFNLYKERLTPKLLGAELLEVIKR